MYILNFFAHVNLHADHDLFYGRHKLMHLLQITAITTDYMQFGSVEIDILGCDSIARYIKFVLKYVQWFLRILIAIFS